MLACAGEHLAAQFVDSAFTRGGVWSGEGRVALRGRDGDCCGCGFGLAREQGHDVMVGNGGRGVRRLGGLPVEALGAQEAGT